MNQFTNEDLYLIEEVVGSRLDVVQRYSVNEANIAKWRRLHEKVIEIRKLVVAVDKNKKTA